MEEREVFANEEGLHQEIVIKLSSGASDLKDPRTLQLKHLGIKGHCLIGSLAPRQLLIRNSEVTLLFVGLDFDNFSLMIETVLFTLTEASLTKSATCEEVWKKTHIKIRDEKEVWVETQTEDTYIITMDSIAEVVGISTLKPRNCIWMIKVLVIERGPTKPFKNGGGSRKMVIIVDEEVKYGKFTATIVAILNSDEPYYDSCTNCYRKVKITDNIVKCPGCPTKKITYADR
ncbi:hypothetical protein FXO38_07272 [Capsicum annuum]|nr:hypothetical protein FXO38_07272 [Capsicum annuum]